MSLLNQGYNTAVVITPSDSVNILPPFPTSDGTDPTDAIYVGTKGSTGTIVAVMASGYLATFVGLIPGTIYPLRVLRVNSTTTDASNLVGLYIR